MIVIGLINVDTATSKIVIHTNLLCDCIPSQLRKGSGTNLKLIENLGTDGGWFSRFFHDKDIKWILQRNTGKPNLSDAKSSCSSIFADAFGSIESIKDVSNYRVSVCC